MAFGNAGTKKVVNHWCSRSRVTLILKGLFSSFLPSSAVAVVVIVVVVVAVPTCMSCLRFIHFNLKREIKIRPNVELCFFYIVAGIHFILSFYNPWQSFTIWLCIASKLLEYQLKLNLPRYPTENDFYLPVSKDLQTYLALHTNSINKGALMQARLFIFISNIYFAKKR